MQLDALIDRKELAARARAWAERSPQRESFHRDVDRSLACTS